MTTLYLNSILTHPQTHKFFIRSSKSLIDFIQSNSKALIGPSIPNFLEISSTHVFDIPLPNLIPEVVLNEKLFIPIITKRNKHKRLLKI